MDFKDPALQTGPFPAWPTLPQQPQQPPRYLENDPTPWQGGDFPGHVTPAGILMALLGAKAGMKRGAQASYKPPVVPGMFQAEEQTFQQNKLLDDTFSTLLAIIGKQNPAAAAEFQKRWKAAKE